MQFLHIKSLEKYHPGYKDRTLKWAKIYFQMVQGNPDCEMITNEIDWARLIKFILLELQAQRPIPLDPVYLTRKGFDLRKRPINNTLKELQQFIEVRNETDTEPLRFSYTDKEEDKDKEEEEDKNVRVFWDYFLNRTGKKFKLTPDNTRLIEKRLKEYTLDDLKKAVDGMMSDEWVDRKNNMQLVHCIGVRNKIDNLEKWLEYKPSKKAGVQTL